MSTDNLVPIDFSRNITPFVAGDVYLDNQLHIEVIMSDQVADAFNKGPSSRFDDRYFVVSFADRPNTGTQPVDDDVIVDVYFDCSYQNTPASGIKWSDDKGELGDDETWKPNHEAMLKQFKSEQGANMNTFTKENTEEATHLIFYHSQSKVAFANKDSNEIFHDDEEWRESGFMWEKSGRAFIELSRPVGERKEDHTDENGNVTYAQTQGAKQMKYAEQETELATHYSGNNNRYYIKGYGANRKAMVLNDVGRWIRSDCTTNDELNGDEFWKLDANKNEHKEDSHHIALQIEKLGNQPLHHVDLAISAGAVDDIVISPDKPTKDLGSESKPFSSDYYLGDPPLTAEHGKEIIDELADNDKPEIELLICGGKNVPEVYKAGRFAYHGAKYSIFVTEDGKEYSRKNSKIKTRPIDNRSEDQKLRDAATESLAGYLGDLCPMPDVVNKAIEWHFFAKGV